MPHLMRGSRGDVYLDALAAMRTLDIAERGGSPMAIGYARKAEWLGAVWGSPVFAELCTSAWPDAEAHARSAFLYVRQRTRSGWAVALFEEPELKGRSVSVSVDGDPAADVDLATIIGCSARITGLMMNPVKGRVHDSGTVVATTAALVAAGSPDRALGLYRLMDSVGLVNKVPRAFRLELERWAA